MNTLTAFCDLAICPVSYDFSVWLVRAMMERDARGCDGLHVVLVPCEDGLGGFARNWGEHDEDDTRWRLWHIVMAMVPLARATVTLAASREQAEQIARTACFWWPEGRRHLSGPLVEFARAGKAIPKLDATPQAKKYVAAWIGERKLATITLRQMVRSPERNSNVGAWVEFADDLDASGYRVEFISDSEVDLRRGRGFAALDPDLRLALYQRADINFVGQNGPAALCWHSDAKFMQFGFGLPAETWGRHCETNMALKAGQQLPWARDQIIVWRPDTVEIIREEFGKWVSATT